MSEIARVAARYGFGYLFDEGPFGRLPGFRSDGTVRGTRGQRLRMMLEELGPSYVKLGQMLSTRPDLVPPDILVELEHLQDAVRPFAYELVEETIVEELGQPIEELFASFEREPLAAASIGQVHRAVLPGGNRVAVKVQRPDAAALVEADIALFYEIASVLQETVRKLDFVDLHGLIDEFARGMRQELDYRAEARNAQLLGTSFADDASVVVPSVHTHYTTGRVLTLTEVEGTPLRELLHELPEDERRRLAYRLAELWMEMVFHYGYFHGDPHPANILVLPDGRVGLVDFGVVGRLSERDVDHLTMLFVDAVLGNVDALPRRLGDLGVRYARRQEDDLRSELAALWHRYHGRSLEEVDPRELLTDILGVIYRQRLQLPTRFLLLDRALITLGSVGQSLYPPFNVFEVARPYAQSLAVQRLTPGRLLRRARGALEDSADALVGLPRDTAGLIEDIRRGELEVSVRLASLEDPLRRFDATANRLVLALLLSALLVGSSLIAGVTGGPHVLGIYVGAFIGYFSSLAIGLLLVYAMLRRGRL